MAQLLAKSPEEIDAFLYQPIQLIGLALPADVAQLEVFTFNLINSPFGPKAPVTVRGLTGKSEGQMRSLTYGPPTQALVIWNELQVGCSFESDEGGYCKSYKRLGSALAAVEGFWLGADPGRNAAKEAPVDPRACVWIDLAGLHRGNWKLDAGYFLSWVMKKKSLLTANLMYAPHGHPDLDDPSIPCLVTSTSQEMGDLPRAVETHLPMFRSEAARIVPSEDGLAWWNTFFPRNRAEETLQHWRPEQKQLVSDGQVELHEKALQPGEVCSVCGMFVKDELGYRIVPTLKKYGALQWIGGAITNNLDDSGPSSELCRVAGRGLNKMPARRDIKGFERVVGTMADAKWP